MVGNRLRFLKLALQILGKIGTPFMDGILLMC